MSELAGGNALRRIALKDRDAAIELPYLDAVTIYQMPHGLHSGRIIGRLKLAPIADVTVLTDNKCSVTAH